MTYIEKLTHEIAEEMAIKELKRIHRIVWFIFGFVVGLLFWFTIVFEIYTFVPYKCGG